MFDPSLPVIELHRHLDGNIRLETILDLAEQHGIDLPARDVESLRPHVEVDAPQVGLMEFIARIKYVTGVLADADACRRVAYENVEDAEREGIDYIELRFSPWFMAQAHSLVPETVVEAIVDGVRAGQADTGVKVRLIGILSRTFGADTGMREVDAILRCGDDFAALDLAGDEARFPAPLFRNHFRKAHDAGLAITVHAGEVAGPESIWSAITDLGASRIGHGITALRDPALLGYLLKHRIGLEVCLTSNVQTSAVKSYQDHPLTEILRSGLLANLNTDNPVISGIDLRHECEVAAPAAGLDDDMLRQVQLNALEMAFLPAAEKTALRRQKADSCTGNPSI